MASRAADEGRELFQLAMDLTNALIASNRNRRLFYEGGDKVRNFSIVRSFDVLVRSFSLRSLNPDRNNPSFPNNNNNRK